MVVEELDKTKYDKTKEPKKKCPECKEGYMENVVGSAMKKLYCNKCNATYKLKVV